jgi:hypothetical protein
MLKAKFYFSGILFVSHWLELHKEHKGFLLNLIVVNAWPESRPIIMLRSVKIKSLGVRRMLD